jgi:hypothetical protein
MTKTTTVSALTMAAILAVTVHSALPATAQDGGAEPPMDQVGPMGPMGLMGPRDAMVIFDLIDTDGNGTITAEEITAFRSASVLGVDANADGKLSAEELAARQIEMMTQIATARAARMVAELDVDGDGLLSVEEMAARPMPVLNLGRLDADGDGSITRDEAERAQAQMRERWERRGEGRGDGPRGPRHGHGRGGPDNG